MARDGSGNYARIHDWVTDLGNSIVITASRMDAEMDSEATALTNSLDRSTSGGGDILRDVGMSNHKFTAMSEGSALLDSIRYSQAQDGSISFFGTTAGTSTVYTLAPSPSISDYTTGLLFSFKVDEDCGLGATLNISGKGAKNIKKWDYTDGTKDQIEAGNLQTGLIYRAIYDGTDIIVYLLTRATTAEINSGTNDTRYVTSLGLRSADVGKLAQVVNTQTGVVATGTTEMVRDDSIPQNDEGDEYMTLAITPVNASNTLEITVVINMSNSSAVGQWGIGALFQDSTANALAVAVNGNQNALSPTGITFKHRMTAGTTSATTFKVRAGFDDAGTTTFNGRSGGRLFGGVMASSITIKEIIV